MMPLVTGLAFAMLVLLAVPSATAAEQAATITLDELVARNTEAMGGRAAIEAVHALEVKLHVSNPEFEVDGLYRAVRPGKMRIDVSRGGEHVLTEAFDGEKAWQWRKGKEKTEASPSATAALRHGVELPGNLFGLHELRARAHGLELSGREDLDGINYYKLRVTLADGYETTLYVDPSSWRITKRRDVRALHPDIDPTPTTIEGRKLDFRKVGDVWFAFGGEDVDVKTGKVLETTRIEEVKVNPAIDAAIFTRPPQK